MCLRSTSIWPGTMADRLRVQEWSGIAVLRRNELIAWAPPGQPQLGFASDLGTTKMAGYLIDLGTGQLLASRGVMNPQIAYGEDVMARIGYAMESAEHAETLARVVRETFNDMIAEMCEEANTTVDAVTDAVIVGNTAMHHLFAGLPVRQLGLAPYVAVVSEAMDIKARDVGSASGAWSVRSSAAEHCGVRGSRSSCHALGDGHLQR